MFFGTVFNVELGFVRLYTANFSLVCDLKHYKMDEKTGLST